MFWVSLRVLFKLTITSRIVANFKGSDHWRFSSHHVHLQRRETWCPGAGLSKAPLASTVFSSVKSRLQRIPSSPSSDESEFGEMTKDMFLTTLEEEEDIKSSESGKKRVVFASPAGKRLVSINPDRQRNWGRWFLSLTPTWSSSKKAKGKSPAISGLACHQNDIERDGLV